MTGRLNWSRMRSRDLMWHHGVENVQDEANLLALLLRQRPTRRRASKAELRAQAADAVSNYGGTIAREVRCRCVVTTESFGAGSGPIRALGVRNAERDRDGTSGDRPKC